MDEALSVEAVEANDDRELKLEDCFICNMPQFLYPLECPHKFCLQCIKGCSVTSGACPYCRQTFSDAFITTIRTNPSEILNLGQSIDAQITELFDRFPDGLWAYEGRMRGYWLFTENIQNEIQTCLAEGRTRFETLLCGQMVTIDVLNRVQQNKVTLATRDLHVLPNMDSAIKGIAGMPIQ